MSPIHHLRLLQPFQRACRVAQRCIERVVGGRWQGERGMPGAIESIVEGGGEGSRALVAILGTFGERLAQRRVGWLRQAPAGARAPMAVGYSGVAAPDAADR